MTHPLPTFLALAPDTALPTLSQPVTPAFLAYQITQEGQLLRAGQSAFPVGSVLMLGGTPPASSAGIDWLCRQIIAETKTQQASGIIANWAETEAGHGLARQLAVRLRQEGHTFWVPESFAQAIPSAQVLISSQLSGGTLAGRLREALSCYGPRITLALECTPWDFLLPAPDGQGTPMTLAKMRALFASHRCRAWFSPELCCQYFTYRQEEQLHLVLYDNAASIQAKLALAAELALSGVLLAWDEVADFQPPVWA